MVNTRSKVVSVAKKAEKKAPVPRKTTKGGRTVKTGGAIPSVNSEYYAEKLAKVKACYGKNAKNAKKNMGAKKAVTKKTVAPATKKKTGTAKKTAAPVPKKTVAPSKRATTGTTNTAPVAQAHVPEKCTIKVSEKEVRLWLFVVGAAYLCGMRYGVTVVTQQPGNVLELPPVPSFVPTVPQESKAVVPFVALPEEIPSVVAPSQVVEQDPILESCEGLPLPSLQELLKAVPEETKVESTKVDEPKVEKIKAEKPRREPVKKPWLAEMAEEIFWTVAELVFWRCVGLVRFVLVYVFNALFLYGWRHCVFFLVTSLLGSISFCALIRMFKRAVARREYSKFRPFVFQLLKDCQGRKFSMDQLVKEYRYRKRAIIRYRKTVGRQMHRELMDSVNIRATLTARNEQPAIIYQFRA